MGIVKEVIKKQINSNNLQYVYSTMGTIVKYDKVSNTADISYNNPVGNGDYYQTGIPISNSLGGLTTGAISSGKTCIITFVNGNVNAPLITGIVNSTYNQKTCIDEGAYIVDEYIRESTKIAEPETPMCENWIDNNNTFRGKFNAFETDFININARAQVQNIINNTDKFSSTEIGLTHLNTKSTLKMKDNGDIDIFVSDNVGVRISKKMRKIYLYGFDVNINGEIDLLDTLKKCHDCEFRGHLDETEKDKIKNKINEYIDYIENDINELKKYIDYTKETTGNIDYFNSINDTIEKFENLKKKYNEGKYDDDIENLKYVHTQIMSYYEYFEEELIAAKERWGLV